MTSMATVSQTGTSSSSDESVDEEGQTLFPLSESEGVTKGGGPLDSSSDTSSMGPSSSGGAWTIVGRVAQGSEIQAKALRPDVFWIFDYEVFGYPDVFWIFDGFPLHLVADSDLLPEALKSCKIISKCIPCSMASGKSI